MKKKVILVALLIFMFHSKAAISQELNGYIKDFQRDVFVLWNEITKLQQFKPQIIEPVRMELSTQQIWYREYLYKLLVTTTTEFDEKGIERTIKKIDFSTWHKNLYELLNVFADNLYSNQDIQSIAYAVHVSYVRSLSATYLLIESMKRLNLSLNENYKLIHTLAQRSMKWMHFIRNNPALSNIWNSRFFAPNRCFECDYGAFFHFGENNLDNKVYPFERYLIPFVPAHLRSEILKKLLGEITGETIDGIRQLPQEPNDITNSPELQQLILKLQYLLGKKEIRENEKLRKSIEDFLFRLRPNLPPLKPMPPYEKNEDKEDEYQENDSSQSTLVNAPHYLDAYIGII